MKRYLLTLCLLVPLAFVSAQPQAETTKKVSLLDLLRNYLTAERSNCGDHLDELTKLNPTWEQITKTLENLRPPHKEKGLKDATIRLHGSDYKFFFCPPKNYNEKKAYPLIVSLTYKNGTEALAKQMFTEIWDKNVDDYVVIQLPTPGRLFFEGGDYVIEPALRWAVANFNIDTDRIYVAGCSNGGIGALYFSMRHGDLFAAACVFPGIVLIDGKIPDRTAQELTNLYKLPVLFWAGSKDKDWYDAAVKSSELLERAGGKAVMVGGNNEDHIPSAKVNIKDTFIKHFRAYTNERPDKFQWYFHDSGYPAAHNLELVGNPGKLEVSSEITPGKIIVKGVKSKVRVYFTDDQIKNGKIVIQTDFEEAFNSEPPADIRLRLLALYQGFIGGGYTWCVELK